MARIDDTIARRGRHYGGFEGNARIAQNIKAAMRDSPNWEDLPPDMKESLELTATKIARILNGDPNWPDSWRDISGYATLIESRLPE
jgi:hypothetical protein